MARGGMRLNITADTRGLNKGLSQAQGSVDRFARGAGRLSRLGGGGIAGVVTGLTSLGGAAAFVRESVTATNDLYKASKRLGTITGMDVRTSSEWVSLARSRGVESEVLARSYTGLAKQLGVAQRGGKTANETFRQLGVTQDMIKRGNTSEIMGQLAEGFSKHADGLSKARVASQLFGRTYGGMLRILNGGKQNLTDLLSEEARHGPVLDANTKKYENARKAQIRFNESMERLKVTVGSAVLPYVTRLADVMSKWLGKASNRQQIDHMVKAFADIAKQGALVVKALVPIVTGIGKFVGSHPKLAKIVADMIALGFAIKALSFINPLRGALQLILRVKALRAAGIAGGSGMANGIMAGMAKAKGKITAWLVALQIRMGTAGALVGRTFGIAMNVAIFAAAALLVSQLPSLIGGALKALGIGDSTTATSWSELFGGGKASGTVEDDYETWKKKHPGKSFREFSIATRKQRGVSVTTGRAPTASEMNNQLGILPQFDAGSGGSSTPSALKQNTSKKKKVAKKQVTAVQAMARANKLRHWAHPFDVRLSKISVNDHTLAAERRRKAILEQAVAKWKSVRSELKKLAADAHRDGDAEISGRIWDLIHRGDDKVAKWKIKLSIVADAVKIQSSQDAIDNANRRVAIAQSDLKAEDAFLRAAFGFGDIGSGAANGYLAAGGPGMAGNTAAGGNVNIVINSLHPGDAATKRAIGKAVTASFINQGARKRARVKIGA